MNLFLNYKAEIKLDRENPDRSTLVLIEQPRDRRRKARRYNFWVDDISKSGKYVWAGYNESDYLVEIHDDSSVSLIHDFGYIGREKGDSVDEHLVNLQHKHR